MTSTPLDRRRDQAAAAHTAVEQINATVSDLENRLRTNADLTLQQSQALRNAQAEAKRLKRSLKTHTRDRERLQKAHQKALAKAAKAKNRAESVEAKYSKSVLAELVSKAKEEDRSGGAAAVAEPAAPAASATHADPAPEVVTAPARTTAARTTATKAAASAATPGSGRATSRNTNATPATPTAAKRAPVRRAR